MQPFYWDFDGVRARPDKDKKSSQRGKLIQNYRSHPLHSPSTIDRITHLPPVSCEDGHCEVLTGYTALIIGKSSTGLVIAQQLAQQGCSVVIADELGSGSIVRVISSAASPDDPAPPELLKAFRQDAKDSITKAGDILRTSHFSMIVHILDDKLLYLNNKVSFEKHVQRRIYLGMYAAMELWKQSIRRVKDWGIFAVVCGEAWNLRLPWAGVTQPMHLTLLQMLLTMGKELPTQVTTDMRCAVPCLPPEGVHVQWPSYNDAIWIRIMEETFDKALMEKKQQVLADLMIIISVHDKHDQRSLHDIHYSMHLRRILILNMELERAGLI